MVGVGIRLNDILLRGGASLVLAGEWCLLIRSVISPSAVNHFYIAKGGGYTLGIV